MDYSFTSFFKFLAANPLQGLGVCLIIFLIFYQQILKESNAHPEKKDKTPDPPVTLDFPDKAVGIVFGKSGKKVAYSPADQEGHVFVCAATGTGKTTSIAIPSIRSFCKEQNGVYNTCFAIDISGDIEPHCDVPNKIVFDVKNPNSPPYNIFEAIDAEPDREEQDLLLINLSYIIMPEMINKNISEASEWFQEGGRNILTAALLFYYHRGLDFTDICYKIKSMGFEELFNEIDKDDHALLYIKQFDGANEKNIAGCKGAADDAIKIFVTIPSLKKILRRPKDGEIVFSPTLLETHNLFLKVPDEEVSTYGQLLGIMTSQAFNFCTRRENYKDPMILFVLDEYVSLRINSEAILSQIRKARKKHTRLLLLTQSLPDLKILYGDDVTEAILSNVKYRVILGITDPVSQRYFADAIGIREKRTKSTSFTHDRISTSYSARDEYRVRPEEFGRLRDELYLICNDGSYMKLKKNFFFK